jgi:hypothetical protein
MINSIWYSIAKQANIFFLFKDLIIENIIWFRNVLPFNKTKTEIPNFTIRFYIVFMVEVLLYFIVNSTKLGRYIITRFFDSFLDINIKAISKLNWTSLNEITFFLQGIPYIYRFGNQVMSTCQHYAFSPVIWNCIEKASTFTRLHIWVFTKVGYN